MDNLQKIKEACIKANSEIIELNNGCWIKIWWLDDPEDRPDDPDEIVEFCDRTMRYNGGSQIIEDNTTGTIKILGRPIRLADVLVAMEEKINETLNAGNIMADSFEGNIYAFHTMRDKDFKAVIDHWNLKDDNLEHQPEQTINFIASLLTRQED